MGLIAEVDIGLDLPFGSVNYAMLDEIIDRALREAGIPVTSVEVGGLRPAQPEVDPTRVQPLAPFGPPQPPIGPPGPFGQP